MDGKRPVGSHEHLSVAVQVNLAGRRGHPLLGGAEADMALGAVLLGSEAALGTHAVEVGSLFTATGTSPHCHRLLLCGSLLNHLLRQYALVLKARTFRSRKAEPLNFLLNGLLPFGETDDSVGTRY